jgi:hypothetical protein
MARSPHSALIGTWRFDKKKTLADWVPRKPIKPPQRDLLFKDTQKITIRFTRARRFCDFRSVHDTTPYRVVWSRAKDESSQSQIIISFSAPFHGEVAQHIEFISDDHFRVSTGHNYEYYRRVSPNKSLERTRER